MKELRNRKGITLIALIITIIVLLILAGVSIVTLTGENGILEKASTAKEKTEKASIKEEIQTDILGKQAENQGNISDDTLKGILEKYGVLSDEEKLTDKTLTTTKGNHKIKVSDIWNGTTKEDGPKNPTSTTVANAPDISGFNKSNTYYVSWDLTSSLYQINEDTNLNGTAPSNWYDYTEGGNHWANVKTTGGGNDCYWVWIPRYAYCITTGYQSNTAGTIDIKFLQGTTNTPIDGSSITISNISGSGNWNVHPAFWWDKDNDGVEDEGEQLTGIWVAKFEASSSNVSETTVTSDLSTTGGGDTTNLQVRVKPNVTSWRGITVGNIFTVCRNLTTSGNSLENTNNIDSHMMKNTEWGAVAYLSRSVYGKNGEVWNNPYYDSKATKSSITGLCGNASNGKDNATTDITKTCKYNEIGGGNASTTGNVYGVYDMAGGSYEYVAGMLSNNKKNGNNTEENNYYDFSNSNTYPNRYFDWYAGASESRAENYNANTGRYGDAVYETSASGDRDNTTWGSSEGWFPWTRSQVFIRGGCAYFSGAGLFSFGSHTGVDWICGGFRPVILSSQ